MLLLTQYNAVNVDTPNTRIIAVNRQIHAQKNEQN